jgi:hypothetical protein
VKTQRVNPGIPLTFTVDLHGFPVINIGRHGGFDSDENPKSKSRLDKRIPSRGRVMLRTFFAPKSGNAFVIAPDGSRAGLKWEAFDKPYFQVIMPVETCIASHYGMGRQACPFLFK